MTKAKGLKQLMSVVLCVALLMSCLPMWSWNTSAALVGSADSRTTDPHTLDQWKQYFGLKSNHPQNVALSTEFAGGVWTDKSVFTPADIPAELTRAEYKGHTFSLPDKGDNFLVALSAIASNKEITGYSTIPTDTVLVLDMSSSMRYNDDNGQSAIDELVEATNLAISDLLALNKNNRVAVVLYAGNTNHSFSSAGGTTQILLPLDTYDIRSNGVYLQATSSGGNANWALQVANGVSGTNGTVSGNKATSTGTFIQDGIYEAMKVLLAAEPTVQSGVQAGTQRLPIMVLMTDGEPTLANNDYDGNDAQTDLGNSVMYDFEGSTGTYSHRDTIAFMTMLTAAYAKKQVAAHYGDALFYTLAYGEEVTRLDEALSVMDPEQCSDPLNELWNSFLSDKATTVYRYRQNNRYQYLTVTNAASGSARLQATDKLYVDEYFPAETDEDFAKAFASIVNEIIIQSKYYPTYVERDHDHDGYLTFVDKIGNYMQVGDIKGLVVGDRLFSGAAMASAFGNADATLGTLESPTAMGNAFIASVKERLGIADTAVAQALVADAYKHGQLAYTDDQHFSHYIGWFSDANGTYLDFWHDGMTDQEVAAVAQKGATHIIKSYGFLGDTTVVGGVSDTDMMYMSVRVATSIASGETILTWRLPASLIPTVTYEVSVRVDSDGNIVEVTDLDLETGSAESPIRLLYEVELREDISDWNVTEKVADAYASSTVNKDAGYVFYTNKWTANADDTEANTYSHFEPSVENERYYYTEDTLVYADDEGTLYTGAKPVSGTYYRQYLVYEKLENGGVRAHQHYEPISATSLALAEAYGTNQWVIPKGTVHRYYDFETTPKETNATATMTYSDHPFIVSGTAHYYTYSTQGNNGKLALTPATGIRLTKSLSETVEGASNSFTFTVAGDIATAQVIRVDANGNEASRTALPTSGEVVVAAGETVYIIGLNAGEYTVTEKDHAAYAVSTVTVDGVSAGEQANVTVAAETIHDVQFVNAPKGYGNLLITKEVTHALANHTVPAAVLDQEFTVQVQVGTALAGEELNTLVGSTAGTVTVGADGSFRLTVKHGQTVQVLNLPEETVATVTELTAGLPAYYTYKGIATRDHSGAVEDTDNQVRISVNENATVVVYNTYDPVETDPVNVNVNITKQFNANGWTGNATFTFKLQQWILPAGETAYKWVDMDTAALNFTGTDQKSITLPNGLGGITYKEAGQYAYRVVEVIPADADKVTGVAYDRTHHAFTVTVTDNNGKLEAAVTDAAGNDIAGGYAVTFTNTYHTAPFSFNIIKQVIDTSDNAETPKAGFQFHVVEEKYGNGQWVATGKTAALYSNAAGEAEFATIFEKVDGATYPVYYRYRVTEEVGTLPNWTYATNTAYVYVTLDVDGNGDLVATVTDEDRTPLSSVPTPTFTNTYDPTDATVDLDGAVRKHLEGRTLRANEFTFAVFQNGAYSFTDTQKALLIGKNAADGSVDFEGELTFGKIGTYEFDVVEIAGNLGGVTYTDRVYDLVVEVTDAGNGTLSATYYFEDAVQPQVTFTNTYKAKSSDIVIEGTKVLTGRPMLSGEFDFRLTEVADETGAALQNALVLTAENGSATGDTAPFRFPAITYDKAGTHYYKVEEIAGAADLGVTYATNTYILRVDVTDTGNGALVAEQSLVYSSDNSTALVFRNTYKPAKATMSLHSTKELTGRVLADGEFEFVITETESDFATPVNGGLQATVRNNANGGIDFPEIEFTAEDIRYFAIKEVVGTVPGITYDTSEYHVTITAEDQQKGALALSTYIMKQVVEEDENGQAQTVKVPTSSVIFSNTYAVSGNATVTLNGSKTLNGEVPANRPFEFLLYAADADYTVSGTPETVPQDADGNFKFDITYKPADISDTPYYYVVKEAHAGETIEGVTYDDTVYHIEVKVEDNNEGGIKTTTVIKKDGATAVTALAFANSYRAEETTLSVTGTKTLENRTLGENEFAFFLYPASSEYTIDENATPKETTNKADGSIVFENIPVSEAGTYYFVIREDANTTAERVTNDTSVYRVAIEIKDDEKGKLYEASRIITKEGSTENVEAITFHNVFTPKPADITVDIAVNKTVVNKGSDTITPEGFRFVLENINTNEKWNLTTDENGGAVFTLGYTEEDIGKTYTYTLAEVNDGREYVQYSDAVYTLTVAISLNANNELVAALTKNDETVAAVVAEFQNVYDYTPTTPSTPPTTTPPTTTPPTTTPPTSTPPTTTPSTSTPPTTIPPTTVPPTIPSSRPNSPQTGDSTNIPLYVALLLLSGSGLVVTAFGGKKKKQSED